VSWPRRPANRRSVCGEARVRSQVSPSEVSGAPSSSGIGFCTSTAVALPVLRFSPASATPPMPLPIYMLLSPEGQMGEAWEPSKKQFSLTNRGALDRTEVSLSLQTVHSFNRFIHN